MFNNSDSSSQIVRWVQSRLGGGRTAAAAESRGLAAGNSSAVVAAVAVASGNKQVVPEDLAGDDNPWPSSSSSHLFSIGTLGNGELPETEEDLPEFSVEEVRKMQHALARLLLRARSKKSEATIAGDGGEESGLPLDRFLNCPSSLEVDRRSQRDHGAGGFSPDTKMILTKAKDLLADGNSSSGGDMKKKSFKFLLKKMFVCHGGFVPASSLKDPAESTMEKFLQTMLGKKISVRPSDSSAASRAFFLEGNKAHGDDHHRRRHGEQDEDEKGGVSCKWDRTDSEYT
uniref:NGR2 n=1 Tax=Leersia perrieri TaxID=77586 RepID=A0A0D9VV48_9ORYZ